MVNSVGLRPAPWHAGVVGDVGAFEDREFQAAGEIEEGDRAMLELAADDALRRQAQPVAVEFQRRLEVIDAEGENGDTRFHFAFSFLYS
jgi:hypothetical protein